MENGDECAVKSIHEDFIHLWFCRRSWRANMDALRPMWPELCSLITLIFHIITAKGKNPTFAFWPAERVHLCGTRCSRWFSFETLSTPDNQKHSTHPPLADNTSSVVLAWGLSVVLDVHYTGSSNIRACAISAIMRGGSGLFSTLLYLLDIPKPLTSNLAANPGFRHSK